MPPTDIQIRPIADLQGCAHVREMQRRVWGNVELDMLPDDVLITMVKNGALLLGAYAADGPDATGGMVGVLLGWPGVAETPAGPRPKHCSHMLGVLPAWQGRDIGRRLKLAQRDALIAQGFADWATWTFDPLLRPNARLNIHRLGGTSSTYLRDVYGAMADDLNAGLPSDRLLVDWHVRSARVVHALAPARRDPPWGDLARMSTSRTTAGRLAPGGLPAPEGAPVGLPLPEDVAGIRRDDMGLLAEWRLALRAAFEALFAAGYTLADVAPIAGGPQGSDHYILTPPGYRAGVPWP